MFLTDAGGRPGLGKDVAMPLPPVPGLPKLDVPFGAEMLSALPQVGVFSPWATQVSDLEWTELTHATADLILFDMAPVLALTGGAFGSPGFVAIVKESPLAASAAEAAFEGTPYALHSIQAAYRQNDGAALPKIYFLLWGALADPGSGGAASLEARARGIGGRLTYAVPVAGQSRSPQPSLAEAWAAQFTDVPAITGQGPVYDPRPPPPPLEEGGIDWLTPALVGLGIAVVTAGAVYALRRP
jgi:hypothetical protein